MYIVHGSNEEEGRKAAGFKRPFSQMARMLLTYHLDAVGLCSARPGRRHLRLENSSAFVYSLAVIGRSMGGDNVQSTRKESFELKVELLIPASYT